MQEDRTVRFYERTPGIIISLYIRIRMGPVNVQKIDPMPLLQKKGFIKGHLPDRKRDIRVNAREHVGEGAVDVLAVLIDRPFIPFPGIHYADLPLIGLVFHGLQKCRGRCAVVRSQLDDGGRLSVPYIVIGKPSQPRPRCAAVERRGIGVCFPYRMVMFPAHSTASSSPISTAKSMYGRIFT